jgi:glycogen operon protein
MLAMGDEVGRSQGGNNNAYCQDNALSWFDWGQLEATTDLCRFVRELINYRKGRDVVIGHDELTLTDLIADELITWHGVKLNHPDWGQDSHSFAVTMTNASRRSRLHLMANAWWEPLVFEVPPANAGEKPWRNWIDTAKASPLDILSADDLAPSAELECRVHPRSIQVLRLSLE